eukprot:1341268-Pleurochrysis_carterae.AAC.1
MPLETSPATPERTYHGPETRDGQTFNKISMCVPTTALQAYQRQSGELKCNESTVTEGSCHRKVMHY